MFSSHCLLCTFETVSCFPAKINTLVFHNETHCSSVGYRVRFFNEHEFVPCPFSGEMFFSVIIAASATDAAANNDNNDDDDDDDDDEDKGFSVCGDLL